MRDFYGPLDVVAYLFGEFGGGLLGVIALTLAWSALLRPIGAPIVVAIAASGLSWVTATALGGYIFGTGRVTDFAFSFGRYAVPQLVVFAVMLGLARRRAKTT